MHGAHVSPQSDISFEPRLADGTFERTVPNVDLLVPFQLLHPQELGSTHIALEVALSRVCCDVPVQVVLGIPLHCLSTYRAGALFWWGTLSSTFLWN